MKEEIETLEITDDRKNISVIKAVIYTILNAIFSGIIYLIVSIIFMFIIGIFNPIYIGYTIEIIISLVYILALKTGINHTFKNRKLKKENNSIFLKTIIIIIIAFNVWLGIVNFQNYQINVDWTENTTFTTQCTCLDGDKECEKSCLGPISESEKEEEKEWLKKYLIFQEILIIIGFSIEVAFITDYTKKRIN